MVSTLKRTLQNLKHILRIGVVRDGDVWVNLSHTTDHAKGLSCRMKFSLDVGAGFRDLKIANRGIFYQGIWTQDNDRSTTGASLSSLVVGGTSIGEDSKDVLRVTFCLGVTFRGAQANERGCVGFLDRWVSGVQQRKEVTVLNKLTSS